MMSRVLLVVLMVGVVSVPVNAEVLDRVLAVVEGRLIMLSDVMAAREFGLLPTSESDESTAAILETLIDRALILHEVDRYAPPDPDPEELDRQLQPIRARFSSIDEYEAALDRTGLGEPHLREHLRHDLRIRAYLDQRFSVAPASEDELGLFYREHTEQFIRQGQLQSFEQVRSQIERAVSDARRRTLVEQWTDDLRSRAALIKIFEGEESP